MNNEFDLLLLCLPSSVKDTHKEMIRTLSKDVDWNKFIQLINRHRVHAKVYRNLSRIAGELVPPEHFNTIKKGFESNTRSALMLASELVHLVKIFRNHDIPAIAMKGAVNAVRIYGDVSYRNAHDVDILIQQEKLDQVHDLMIEEGYNCYHPYYRLSSYQQRVYLSTNNHIKYIHNVTGLQIEIHIRIYSNPYLLSFSFDELIGQSQSISLAGEPLIAFDDKILFLHLFTHGAHHFWFRLSWLCDVMEILEHNHIKQWGEFLEFARLHKLEKSVIQGVLLSHKFFNTNIPEEFQQYEHSKEMNWFVESALNRINRMEIKNRDISHIFLTEIPYHLKLKESLKYKQRTIFRYFFCHGDMMTVRLPDVLTPLYYALRPLLWILRKLSRRR